MFHRRFGNVMQRLNIITESAVVVSTIKTDVSLGYLKL